MKYNYFLGVLVDIHYLESFCPTELDALACENELRAIILGIDLVGRQGAVKYIFED